MIKEDKDDYIVYDSNGKECQRLKLPLTTILDPNSLDLQTGFYASTYSYDIDLFIIRTSTRELYFLPEMKNESLWGVVREHFDYFQLHILNSSHVWLFGGRQFYYNKFKIQYPQKESDLAYTRMINWRYAQSNSNVTTSDFINIIDFS